MKRYKLDYTINTSINVSMVDFKNAGLSDEDILKVVRSKEYVNCANMTRSFSGCEITFYGNCFNRTLIEQTVQEIQDELNALIQPKENNSIYRNLSYKTKLDIQELPNDIKISLNTLFNLYNYSLIGLCELISKLDYIYDMCDYSDKDVIACIIFDIKRIKG